MGPSWKGRFIRGDRGGGQEIGRFKLEDVSNNRRHGSRGVPASLHFRPPLPLTRRLSRPMNMSSDPFQQLHHPGPWWQIFGEDVPRGFEISEHPNSGNTNSKVVQ